MLGASFYFHGSRKGFSEGCQKIIGVYSGSQLATGAARSAAEGSRLGSGGASPQRGPGAAPRCAKCLTLLPIFEHGLQFRFNEITYFLEH